MKFKSIFKNILKASSKDDYRVPLQGVFIHNNHMIATDSFKLVSVPCKLTDDEKQLFPDGVFLNTNYFKQNVKLNIDNTYSEIQLSDPRLPNKFPNAESVIINAQRQLDKPNSICVLSFDLNHLMTIKDILFAPTKKKYQNKKINFVFHLDIEDGYITTQGPILITSDNPDYEDAIAILMPCVVNPIETINSIKEIKFEERKKENIRIQF